MAALTNPGSRPTEFAGRKKLLSIYALAVGSASDTLTLSLADNGVSTIYNVVGTISGGQDAAFANIGVSFSGLVITITSIAAAGTAATDWTGATVNLMVEVA